MAAEIPCRTAALGGQLARCEERTHEHIAYSPRHNRHCPKSQGAATKAWPAARRAGLLLVEYCYVIFTLPAPITDIAYRNKAAVDAILFKAAAETPITIAAGSKHLGARIGLTAMPWPYSMAQPTPDLRTWFGSEVVWTSCMP